MPRCASQIILCDVPIRFDTYAGCSHGCKYCFARKVRDIREIKPDEGVEALRHFINGERTQETRWCDWDIPIHWGGMSDPFQPCEKIHGRSLECLKLLRETQYPFIVSTKGKLVADDEYLDVIKDCNCIVQISAVCSEFDVLEQGCPSFEERMEIVRKIAATGTRVIVRIQPYMTEVFNSVMQNIPRWADAGAYAVILEGMKYQRKKKGLVKVMGDFCYPKERLAQDFEKIKAEAHRCGLKFYCGENRLREMGDSLCCCGADDMEGWKSNHYNFSHIINGDKPEPTESQLKAGTANPSFSQTTIGSRRAKEMSFVEQMADIYNKNPKNIKEMFGKL